NLSPRDGANPGLLRPQGCRGLMSPESGASVLLDGHVKSSPPWSAGAGPLRFPASLLAADFQNPKSSKPDVAFGLLRGASGHDADPCRTPGRDVAPAYNAPLLLLRLLVLGGDLCTRDHEPHPNAFRFVLGDGETRLGRLFRDHLQCHLAVQDLLKQRNV